MKAGWPRVLEFGNGKNLVKYFKQIWNTFAVIGNSLDYLIYDGMAESKNYACQYNYFESGRYVTSFSPVIYFDELLSAYVELLHTSVIDILGNPSIRFHPEFVLQIVTELMADNKLLNDTFHLDHDEKFNARILIKNVNDFFDEIYHRLYEIENQMEKFRNFWSLAVVSSTESLGMDLLKQVDENLENFLCSIWNVQYERKDWSKFIRQISRGIVVEKI